MHFVTDLHLHSKYSRAVSPQMTLPVMAHYAAQKGLDILTTGDYTHPLWLKEIKEQLEEAGEGVYQLKSQNAKVKSTIQKSKVEQDVLFLLSTEISSIYKQGDKLRRIHNLVFMPDFDSVDKFNNELRKRNCNLNSDGRPIIGLSSKNLLELILTINERAFLIPCHVWTPHFGLYGSASGFNSIEESFGDLSKYIYGIETGISSDPEMNWRVKELENRSILSFSDAHSPAKMGREATVFRIKNLELKIKENLKISYEDLRKAIMRDDKGRLEIAYTVEFYPEEGKYHFSGHRNCKYVADPKNSQKSNHICPVCKRRLTEGVLYRVEQLTSAGLIHRAEINKDENKVLWHTDTQKNHPPFVKIVPLLEIVAQALYSTVASQKTKNIYDNLCAKLGNEMNILLNTAVGEISKHSDDRIGEGIEKVRNGNIVIKPGYDGEYGIVRIWDAPDSSRAKTISKQKNKTSKGQLGLDI